ncbi:MAG: lipoyl synthase [Kiritimatiellae bacterium]|nr:lipoyl synthase [Kiritimatiellia bacterium]
MNSDATEKRGAKPPWIRVRIGQGQTFQDTRSRLRAHGLHTVCEEAACPNLGHCWSHGRATIMILGDRCTRGCRFCNVDKRAVLPPDPAEPQRVAAAVKETGLKEVVLTSVTRDDLPDGGAALWAATVRAVHEAVPGIQVEVLVPDFGGSPGDIATVVLERPAVFGHNLETVPRIYPHARPQADYARSLDVLRQASEAGLITKTSLMLGLGETLDEIAQTLHDARAAGCRIFYAGQYLQPSARHLPVARFLDPAEFDRVKELAYAAGFGFVASAPLVRSSYHEDGQSAFVKKIKPETGG